jgi:hypothetical protein
MLFTHPKRLYALSTDAKLILYIKVVQLEERGCIPLQLVSCYTGRCIR